MLNERQEIILLWKPAALGINGVQGYSRSFRERRKEAGCREWKLEGIPESSESQLVIAYGSRVSSTRCCLGSPVTETRL